VITWLGGRGPADGPKAGGDERATARPAARTGRPILVVDDDTSILETITAILEGEGYEVTTATNGVEALELLERVTPLLILLDMRMPVLDGWGVAKALAARDLHVPVVVMTAAENAKRWADEIKAQGHLAKPFELTALLEAVERFRTGPRPN
jgi:CheY-like chemotaxis protein